MARPTTRSELLAHIEAHPVEGTLSQQRKAFEVRLASPPLGRAHTLHGNRGHLFGEIQANAPLCLFLHGGGYVLGTPRTQSALAQALSLELDAPVFSANYPLAPEHIWPRPLQAVLDLAIRLDKPFWLAGSSAGGHLALNLLRRLAGTNNADRVLGLALFSPNTDRTDRSRTRVPNTPSDPMNSDAGDRAFYTLSMPRVPDYAPAASPWLGRLSHLPPTFLSATEGEVLLGDTHILQDALDREGIASETFIAPPSEAGLHMFESWPSILPAGREAIARAASFLRSHA